MNSSRNKKRNKTIVTRTICFFLMIFLPPIAAIHTVFTQSFVAESLHDFWREYKWWVALFFAGTFAGYMGGWYRYHRNGSCGPWVFFWKEPIVPNYTQEQLDSKAPEWLIKTHSWEEDKPKGYWSGKR